MKKIMNKINFALIGLMVSVPAFAAASAGKNGICDLIEKMQGIFKLLRTLAFVGAAFYIAGWAWGWITKGEVGMEDVKKKGIGLLVGFSLLFFIGLVLSFLLSASGGKALFDCETQILQGWK